MALPSTCCLMLIHATTRSEKVWRGVHSSWGQSRQVQSRFTAAEKSALLPQGFAVTISHTDLVTSALEQALMRVLTELSFTEAATRVSLKLRTRKRTPLQEAVGGHCHLSEAQHP